MLKLQRVGICGVCKTRDNPLVHAARSGVLLGYTIAREFPFLSTKISGEWTQLRLVLNWPHFVDGEGRRQKE